MKSFRLIILKFLTFKLFSEYAFYYDHTVYCILRKIPKVNEMLNKVNITEFEEETHFAQSDDIKPAKRKSFQNVK